MPTIYGLSFTLAGATPSANPGVWQVVDTKSGLLEFARVVGKANLIGATGGTLDVVMQTGVMLPGTVTVAPGSWKDIWRPPQLVAGAPAISYDVVISRAATSTSVTPGVVNTTDLSPTIPANTVLPQSMQDAIRLIVLPGAGTTAGAQLVFFLNASP